LPADRSTQPFALPVQLSPASTIVEPYQHFERAYSPPDPQDEILRSIAITQFDVSQIFSEFFDGLPLEGDYPLDWPSGIF
jgi:hypothetical protein